MNKLASVALATISLPLIVLGTLGAAYWMDAHIVLVRTLILCVILGGLVGMLWYYLYLLFRREP